MRKGTTPSCQRFQFHTCWCTQMSRVVNEPVISTTDAMARLMAASYEIIWADARTDPSRGYLEPDDHPARNTPYTAIDDIASRKRIPMGGLASWMYVSCPA